MKKIYNVLLTFLLICTLIPINVSAEGEGDFSTPTDTNITETDSSVVEINSNEDLGDDNINTTQDETSSETLENASDDELAQEVEINQENNEETETLEEQVEENYPIFSENKTIDGVVISVNAEEGVFPEGSKLSVEKVVYYVQKQVDNVLDEVRNEEANVVASYTFDIKILDSEGNDIQPKDDSKVKVSFTLAEASNENLDTNVYHIDDKQEEITSNSVQTLDVVTEGEDVVVETNGFSIYTVEFTYNNKEYVLDGDNYIKLYELLAHIGLTGEVSSWEVSDTSLFNIFRGTEDEVSYDYEIIDENIYDFPVDNPDGDVLYIIPLQMFNTEEWLKVTIDGIEYEIKVTDDNIYQTVPASYSGNISTNNDDNLAITGDTYFLDAPKPDYVMQSQSTTSATDFAAGLPLSTIFIDVDKIGNANNIEVQGEFTLLTENEAIRNGFEHYYTTDGSGKNTQLTGDVVVYNPLADTENLMQIEPNKINVLEGDLFQFIYRDAAILPNGNRAHVKMVYSNAKIAVDQRLGVTDTASGLTASNYQGAIYLARGGTVARGGTDDRYMGYKNRSTTTYPNQPFTQTQRKAMQEAVDNTLSTNWGQSFSTDNANTADTIALGQSIDVKYQVVDDDGNPVDGTFIFAVTGINLDRDPYSVSGNNICKPIWSYTVDNQDVHFFSEAMSINQGKVSDYIYVRPNTNVFESDELKQKAESKPASNKKFSYYYAQVIEDPSGNVKFIGNGYGPSNLGGDDESYNAGFVVLANAKDGITITSTGHATTKQGMNTQAWGGVQIWYRYTSSTGPNGNIQTTSEGNYGGTLDDTSDHGVSSNILDPNTFVVPEGKTVTYTLTPDENYQIAKLQVANANGTMREIKYNGNKPLSSMREGDTYRFNDAAGRQCVLTALADGKFTLEVPYATHDEKFHVEWRRNNASVKIKKDTVDNKEGTFTFKIKAYKKSDVTTYSPILVGSIWKNSETGNYETSFIDGVTVNLTPDEIATILANVTIDTKHFITGAEYTWGSYLAQTNINLSDIGVTYGEDDTLFVGFENLPTSLIGDNVGYALNTGYSAAGPERIYLYHPSTNIEKDVMTYWNFNSLKGQSSNPGWYTFNVNAGEEEELTVEEGYTYEVQEVNDANWQLLDIDGNPIQTATGNLTADNRNPSHEFLNREIPDLTIKKETLNNAPGTFNFTANIYKEEEILGVNHEVTIQAVINNGEISYTLNNAGEELEIPGVAIIPNGEYLFESGNDDLDSLMSIMLYSVKDEAPHNIEIDEDNWQVLSNIDKALGVQVEEMINDGYTSANLKPVTYTFKTETKTIKIPYNPQSLPTEAQCNDGVCTFTLNNGQSITFENVPYGSKYEIVESSQDGWVLIDEINTNGIITENTTAKFINEKRVSLTIKKEADEDTGEEFNFKVKIHGWKQIFSRIGGQPNPSGNSLPEIAHYIGAEYGSSPTYEIRALVNGEEIAYGNTGNGGYHEDYNTWRIEVGDGAGYIDNKGFTNKGIDGGVFPDLVTDFILEAKNYVNLEGNLSFDINHLAEKDGFYTFKLKAGEELTIPNIPYGYEYEIYELDSEGNRVAVGDVFDTKWTLKSATNTSGTLEEDTTSLFTNEIERVNLTIKKETVGNVEGEFEFKVKVLTEKIIGGETPTVNKTSVDLSAQLGEVDEDGYYHFTLNNDESLTIPNLPYGSEYEVIEVAQDGWRLIEISGRRWGVEYMYDGQNLFDDKEVVFVNIPLSTLTITKEVTGNMGNKDEEFEFEIKIWKDKEIKKKKIATMTIDYDNPENSTLTDLAKEIGTYITTDYIVHPPYYNDLSFSDDTLGEEIYDMYDFIMRTSTPEDNMRSFKLSNSTDMHPYKAFIPDVQLTAENSPLEVPIYLEDTDDLYPDNLEVLSSYTYRSFYNLNDILDSNAEKLTYSHTFTIDDFNNSCNMYWTYDSTDIKDCMSVKINVSEFSDFIEEYSKIKIITIEGTVFEYTVENIAEFYGFSEHEPVFDNNEHMIGILKYLVSSTDFTILYDKGEEEPSLYELLVGKTATIEITLPSDTYTFKLKHNESIEIPNIPYGYEYEIVEKDYSDEGYKQSVDGKEGREVSGELTEDKNHLFENRNQVAVPTEVRIKNMIIPGLSVIALILVYFIIKIKKKLNHAR